MKIKQITLSCITGYLLASCALLGPKYQEPNIDKPNNWKSSSINAVSESTNIAELAWWKKFNDPQLNQLIESALTNNNDLQSAMGNMLQAQSSLRQVEMGWVPTIGLSAGTGLGGMSTYGSSNTMPMQNGYQTFNSNSLMVMPTYTLNVFEQIKQGQIAKLNLEMQTQAKNSVRLGVITQVANSYFTLLGLHKQLALQEQTLSDAEALNKSFETKYKYGSTSDTSLEGMGQFLATIRANIPMIKANITQTENALQVLTNSNPSSIKLNNTFDNISTKNIVPVNLPSEVLKTRPDVVMSEYQLKLANANIGAATAQFFPSISLTSPLGQGNMELGNLFNGGANFWMTQLNATMPFFNLGLYAEIDKAKAGYYTAYYNYINTVRTAFSQVDNGLSKNDSLTSNFAQKGEAVRRATNIYNISMKQYKLGSVAYSDTIGNKLNIDYAKSQQNDIKIQQLQSLVNLYQALGGGYMVESNLTQVKKFNDNHDI